MKTREEYIALITSHADSEEYRRKFNVENAEIKVFSDSTKPNQLFLCVNRQPIVEWFKVQWNNLKNQIRPKLH